MINRAQRSSAYRARLFSQLAALPQQQSWDAVFSLLGAGARRAQRAQLQELAEQFERGQLMLLDALKRSGQFFHWELQLMRLGLATGGLQSVHLRLAKHYALQQQLASTLSKSMRKSVAAAALVMVAVFAIASYHQQISPLSALLYSVAAALLLWLLLSVAGYLLRGFFGINLPSPLLALCRRLPGLSQLQRRAMDSHYLQNLQHCLSAELSLAQALKLSAECVPDERASRGYKRIQQQLSEGGKLSSALMASGVLEGVQLGDMATAGATAVDAQAFISRAVLVNYVQLLQGWVQLLPLLLYACIPLLALLCLLVV